MPFINVRDYGAAGNGEQDDTLAIRAAIDACRKAGGGTVYLPAGTYLSGTIQLYDYITLHLESGATLHESFRDNLESAVVGFGKQGPSARPHLIYAHEAHHIAITGQGTILGRGEGDNTGRDLEQRGFRCGTIFLHSCHHVQLTGFTVRNSDAWTLHLHSCENVLVDGVSILNNMFRRGANDGLDLNCCRNVRVSNCTIAAWDDCIVLKTRDASGPDDAADKACERIVVTNCVLSSGCTALKIGSETKGAFRDIHFTNCVIHDSSVGVGIYLLDGATVERVTYSNLSMTIIDDNRYRTIDEPYFLHTWPICFFVSRRHADSRLGTIRDIILRDIQISSNRGAVVVGHRESPIENLTLQNLTLRVDRDMPYVPQLLPCHPRQMDNGDHIERSDRWWAEPEVKAVVTPARSADAPPYRPAYLHLSHVAGLHLDNVKVWLPTQQTADAARAGIVLQHVRDATADHCGTHHAGQGFIPLELSRGYERSTQQGAI